ncbi:MAG: hypothetical protein EPN65_16535 [Pandoraea sp.]|uniref:hypothetical protein n=1 Tax=Pandoraea sp. TaxID=1883445 RepID=UPI001217D69F|nr:hypothetical protein [Pandoraea sp.]TAM15921.1 MAG: hypothetical protein EPN65_16535 [Pandoraea sp.]
MATEHGYKLVHNGTEYLLHCDPMPMADGRFGAQVVIVTGHDGPALVERRFSALEYFEVEDEAVRYARKWGEAWVRDNG